MALGPRSPLPARDRGGQGPAVPGPAWGRRKGCRGHTRTLAAVQLLPKPGRPERPSRDRLPRRPPSSPPTVGPPSGAGREEAQGAGWGAGVGAAAAELLLGAFCMKMAAPTASKAASLGCNNKPAFPELDFRSGARVEELNKLIQEFTKHDQREYDDQRALEIHTAKDFIFSMLGKKGKGGGVRVCDGKRGREPVPPSRALPFWGSCPEPVPGVQPTSGPPLLLFLRREQSCPRLCAGSLSPPSPALLLISEGPGLVGRWSAPGERYPCLGGSPWKERGPGETRRRLSLEGFGS